MNRFKTLDTLFPCGKDRYYGEVVHVTINCVFQGQVVSTYSWKRKAWYVNASVNAFHMHRGLCREFMNENSWVTGGQVRAVKRAFGDIVQHAYMLAAKSEHQYFSFTLDLADAHWLANSSAWDLIVPPFVV